MPSNPPLKNTPPSSISPLYFIIVFLFVAIAGLLAYILMNATDKNPKTTTNTNSSKISRLTGVKSAKPSDSTNKFTLIDSIDSPYVGASPSQATVTVVEFLDFQGPYCKQSASNIKRLIAHYKDKPVRFVFRNLPLESLHPYAVSAAHASLCAHEQKRFIPMHDLLFARQSEINSDNLYIFASEIGLNMNLFSQCMSTGSYQAQIQKDFSDALALDAKGTPTWYINEQFFEGALSFDNMSLIIDKMLTTK